MLPTARRAAVSRAGPTWWVRVADASAWALVSIAGCVALFGGLRIVAGDVRVSVTSGWRAALLAVLVMAARHLIQPQPSIVARLRDAARAWTSHAAFGVVTPVWQATRAGVLAVGLLAVATFGFPAPDSGFRVSRNELVNLPARWDAGWYLGIAVGGYNWTNSPEQQNIAFFPAYPMLMRAGGAVLGSHAPLGEANTRPVERRHTRTLLAGLVISIVASYAALWHLFCWVELRAGAPAAGRAVALLATFPFALFLSAAYTEALYLLGAIAAFRAASSQRWATVAAWGLFVGLLRPNGFLLAVPLAAMAFESARWNVRAWAAAAAPVGGVLMFTAYIWRLTGHPLAWVEAHAAWGRTISGTWAGLMSGPFGAVTWQGVIQYLWSAPVELLNGAALLLALVLLPTITRRLGYASAAFVLVNLIPPVMAGGLLSIGRLTVTLFPVFAGLALVLPPRIVTAWLVGGSLLQGLLAALFFTWRPVI